MAHGVFLGATGSIQKIPFILVSDERWTELQALTTTSYVVSAGGTPNDIFQAFVQLCPHADYNFKSYFTKGTSYQYVQKALICLNNLFANSRNELMENAPAVVRDYAFDSDDSVYNWGWSNCSAFFSDTWSSSSPMAVKLPLQMVSWMNANAGNYQLNMTVIPEGMITQQGHLNYTNYVGQKLIRLYVQIRNPETPDVSNSSNYMYFTPRNQAGTGITYISQTAVSSFLGQWIQNNVNIIKDTPAPSGDAIETAPGQPDNEIDNQGGTGDFSSGTVEDYQTGATGTSGYSGTTYAMNKAAMNLVKAELWDSSYLTLIRDLFGSGQNTVINCLLFPFNVTTITGGQTVSNIILGTHPCPLSTDANASAYAIETGANSRITIGPLTNFNKVLGGFLDDSGVSQCFIHLPFVGLKEIDPQIIYGHSVSVDYIFDFMSGECQALVYSNMLTEADGQTFTNERCLCYEFSGQAGIPIGFTESNINSNRMTVGIQTVKAAISGGKEAAASAVVEGAVSSIGAANAHMEGSTGSGIERMKSMDVYLLFIRPKTFIPKNYNKMKGRPSQQDLKLSECTGFTVVDNPIIETTATDAEREQIIQLLKEGVRIK